MRLALFLSALSLAACGDAQDTADTALQQQAPEETEAAVTAPAGSVSVPDQVPEPAGALGAFTFYMIQEATEDTTRIDGFVPPALPADAVATVSLDAVPSYVVRVSDDGLPDDASLVGTYYVYATVDETGALSTHVLRGHVSFTRGLSGLFRGRAHAFTFPPLWDPSELDPTLTVQESGGEQEFARTTLTTLDAPLPDWIYPIQLPTLPEGADVDFEANVQAEGVNLILVYPKDFGKTPSWDAAKFFEDRSEMRRREREGLMGLGTRYTVSISNLDPARSEAYLIAVPE